MELLDISVSKSLENIDRRTLGGNRFQRIKNPSPYQWPRKYGERIKTSVKDRNWELRNYAPKVVNN